MGFTIINHSSIIRSYESLESQRAGLADVHARWNVASWYALYTRSHHEKLVYRELTHKGIDTFLPLRKITRRWSDRRKTIEEPLFPSYLFVHVPLRDRLSVLRTKGAVRFVGPNPSDPVEVSDGEISSVRRFIEEKIQIDPFPYLKEGEKVYVRSGPLKGIEGLIVRKDRHCRLILSVNALMQSVSIQIDEACVEPAH